MKKIALILVTFVMAQTAIIGHRHQIADIPPISHPLT